MNDAHFHLVVNHLPIIFPLVGVLLLITAVIAKSEDIKRTGYMFFILGAIASILAMASGEGAEDVVEKINGVSKNFIDTHEDSAERFALLSYILGGVSFVGLWASFKKKSFSKTIFIVCFIFAFVVLFFAKEAGTTGGEIRHTEIRNGNNSRL